MIKRLSVIAEWDVLTKKQIRDRRKRNMINIYRRKKNAEKACKVDLIGFLKYS